MSDDQIKFFCEHCGQKIAVARGLAGAAVRCPGCGQAANVPSDRAKTAMVDTSSVASPGQFGGSGPFKGGGPFGGAPEAPPQQPPPPAAPPPQQQQQAQPPPPYTSSPFGAPPPQPAPPPQFTPQPFTSAPQPPPRAQPQPFAPQPGPQQPQPFSPQPGPQQPQQFGQPPPPAFSPQPVFAPMQPAYNPGYPIPQQQNGLAVASLVLGLISAVICCAGPITGMPAIITGVMALQRNQSRGMAITGMVAGGLGMLGGLFYWIATIAGQHH